MQILIIVLVIIVSGFVSGVVKMTCLDVREKVNHGQLIYSIVDGLGDGVIGWLIFCAILGNPWS